jgi:hypothetical protein
MHRVIQWLLHSWNHFEYDHCFMLMYILMKSMVIKFEFI